MGSIRLHKEYGVNPTMPVCFWCGEEKGEVALLGAAYKGEAPSRMILDYNPCQKCEAEFSAGIAIMEAGDRPNHDGQISVYKDRDVYPTGRVVVVTEEAVSKWFEEATAEEVLKHRRTFMDKAMFDQLFGKLVTNAKTAD